MAALKILESRTLEKAFVGMGILFYSDALVSLLQKQGVPLGPLPRLLYYLIPLITLVLLTIYWRKIIPVIVREKIWWLLLGLAIASLFWSAAPAATTRSLLALFRVTLLGVYFGTTFNLKQQFQLLKWTFGIAAVLSFGFAIFLPQYGVMGMGNLIDPENLAHRGAWQGIYTHKNVLGRIMTLSTALFFLSLLKNKFRLYQLEWLGFFLSLFLLFRTTSKTSLVIVLTLMILIPFFRALRWNYSFTLPLLITAIVLTGSISTLFLDNAELILGAMGKDMTLTGRTTLWDSVMTSINERPWLGHGYGGFWLEMDGPSYIVWQEQMWAVPHSHNGFLDTTLDLGYIGLGLFLVGFTLAYLKAIYWVRCHHQTEDLLPLLFLTFMLIFNFSESSFFRQGFIIILYLATILAMHRQWHQSRAPMPSLLSEGMNRKPLGI